ncbi:MAG: ABC transporter substrate-binding protein [Clostridia bacterium]|nr:ABC transporter substrate-binding protein [Clostridia bacterium]
MKKLLAMFLSLTLILTSVAALGAEFTDSTGRTVAVPDEISRVAVSGPLAQIVLFAIAPDMMVGISSAWDEGTADIIGQYYDLPLLGQLYGGRGEMNLEQIAAVAPDVIIDVGEPKDTIVEDLDALTEQVGIPFVHVTMTTDTVPDAFRTLGELLGREEDAQVLADYCERAYARAIDIMEKVGEENKAKLLYCLGDNGLNVIARGSYHAEIIDLLADNLAVVDEPSSRGTGNETDMEQIMLWNPDYIIFAPDSIGLSVADDPAWQSITAIAEGHYAVAPFGPYNWMGFPPSVQRYLGMIWMTKLLYPEFCDYDLYDETAQYYELFYHCELTRERFDELTANASFAG